jgi:hypothetical protein
MAADDPLALPPKKVHLGSFFRRARQLQKLSPKKASPK